jgi:hypothetical protein
MFYLFKFHLKLSKFLISFLNILLYPSSADLSGWLWPKGKSLEMFHIVVLQNPFFKFRFWGRLHPDSPALGCAPLNCSCNNTYRTR